MKARAAICLALVAPVCAQYLSNGTPWDDLMKVPLAKKDCNPSFSAPFDDQDTSGRADGVDDKDLTLRGKEEARKRRKYDSWICLLAAWQPWQAELHPELLQKHYDGWWLLGGVLEGRKSCLVFLATSRIKYHGLRWVSRTTIGNHKRAVAALPFTSASSKKRSPCDYM